MVVSIASDAPSRRESRPHTAVSVIARSAIARSVIARSVLALLALCSAVAACGGPDSQSGRGSRPITRREADVLADLLPANMRAGGAHVVAVVPFGVSTFRLDGDIDWANHVGRVRVRSSVHGAPDPTPRDVVWNPNVVFEEVPGLRDRLAAAGRPGIDWVARPLDPRVSQLHLILRMIDATASTQPDNPQLLRARVTWLRRDSADGVAVDVFRDQRTRYWVDRRNHVLVRLEADLAGTSTRATLTFSDRGPRTIETPPDPSIVALSDVSALYQELVGAAPR